MKNYKAKVYLQHWYAYEDKLHMLEPEHMKKARILFFGLKQLNDYERELMWIKYRWLGGVGMVTKEKYVQVLSGKNMAQYKRTRIDIETRLNDIFTRLEGVEI